MEYASTRVGRREYKFYIIINMVNIIYIESLNCVHLYRRIGYSYRDWILDLFFFEQCIIAYDNDYNVYVSCKNVKN